MAAIPVLLYGVGCTLTFAYLLFLSEMPNAIAPALMYGSAQVARALLWPAYWSVLHWLG